MKTIIIDAGTEDNEKIYGFVRGLEDELKIRAEIYMTKTCSTHEEAYNYFVTHAAEIGTYFVKISTREEFELLQKIQEVKTKAIVMMYTDDEDLQSDLLDFTHSETWTLATVRGERSLRQMLRKILAFCYTHNVKTEKIGTNNLVMTSVLYIMAEKEHRNYLRSVQSDNECLIRTTITEIGRMAPHFIPLGRGLLVNLDHIRRIESDGLTICFEGTTKRITAPKVCKKQLKALAERYEIKH